jgi:hypothetical protein
MAMSSYRCLSFVVLLSFTILANAADVSEESLRAADAEQMRIIVQADADKQRAFMHPNYMINGPSNRVMRKEALVSMLAQGKMASDHFERSIEATAITGNVGVVMGSEVVKPVATSQLGQLHGTKTLARRFTNVFLFDDGQWRFLARQATIVDMRE